MKHIKFTFLLMVHSVAIGFVSWEIYKGLKSNQEPPKPLNVYCIDGSKWKHVMVSYTNNSYDLYTNKWVARVPANACALHAAE